MKIKTSTLAGQALDWAVAKCEGLQRDDPEVEIYIFRKNYSNGFLHYSTDWSQSGPIIERKQISLDAPNRKRGITTYNGVPSYYAHITTDGPFVNSFGPTPLIAAMRCYVASKFGDKVEIPNELI